MFEDMIMIAIISLGLLLYDNLLDFVLKPLFFIIVVFLPYEKTKLFYIK